MSEKIRTQLARYESHLLGQLREARTAARAALRRVEEIEVDLAHAREALAEHHQLHLVSRLLPGEAGSATGGPRH